MESLMASGSIIMASITIHNIGDVLKASLRLQIAC
jgi:hypothetical protein